MDFHSSYTEEVDYPALLSYARKNYDSFTLVWRAGMKFNENAKAVRVALAPYLLREGKQNSWPGTESGGEPSLVSEYSVCKQSIDVLSQVKDVWSWQSPNLPEDLAFYKRGNVIFASVAHEKMAWHENA